MARVWAIEWAREMLETKNWIILNVQRFCTAEPMQIAVIDAEGATLFHSLILPVGEIPPKLPSRKRTPQKRLREWLKTSGAPTYGEIHKELWEILGSHEYMLVYESVTLGLLYHAHALHKLPATDKEILVYEVSKKYAPFYGEWNAETKKYVPQALPGQIFDALQDSRIILELLKEMAYADEYEYQLVESSEYVPKKSKEKQQKDVEVVSIEQEQSLLSPGEKDECLPSSVVEGELEKTSPKEAEREKLPL